MPKSLILGIVGYGIVEACNGHFVFSAFGMCQAFIFSMSGA